MVNIFIASAPKTDSSVAAFAEELAMNARCTNDPQVSTCRVVLQGGIEKWEPKSTITGALKHMSTGMVSHMGLKIEGV